MLSPPGWKCCAQLHSEGDHSRLLCVTEFASVIVVIWEWNSLLLCTFHCSRYCALWEIKWIYLPIPQWEAQAPGSRKDFLSPPFSLQACVTSGAWHSFSLPQCVLPTILLVAFMVKLTLHFLCSSSVSAQSTMTYFLYLLAPCLNTLYPQTSM